MFARYLQMISDLVYCKTPLREQAQQGECLQIPQAAKL